MTLLALLNSPVASGGDTTIRRIADRLTASGYPVLLVPHAGELARAAEEPDVLALVGTHALLSGRPFVEVGLPYVLVLGGTDLNEYALDPEFHALMTEAVEGAAGLVAFNQDFVARSRSLWPGAAEKVRLIPQSVRTALGIGTALTLLVAPLGLIALLAAATAPAERHSPAEAVSRAR